MMGFVARLFTTLAVGAVLGLTATSLTAQTQSSAERQLEEAFKQAKAVAVPGPASVQLIDQATLQLPPNYVFIPAQQARSILTAMGNRAGDDLLGMIFPVGQRDENWFVAVQYEKSGYIKDDDAKDWNADELLANLKAGTEESNKDRKARGIPELEVVGWVERPQYDASMHQLKWSISSRKKGAPDTPDKGINYNTYTLGREGYVSMNLVTDLDAVEAQKPKAAQLLAELKFNDGKRYSDFNSSTDHVAAYGLAALIGGVAAKKLGLLALGAAFFAKFFKVIALAAVALLAGVAKFWKRRKAVSQGGTPPTTSI